MALNLDQGLVLRLRFQQDLLLEYRCFTQVTQEFSNAGSLLGKKEHAWDTRVRQRIIRQEGDISHILTISEPLGDIPQEPIMGAQVARQVMYAQINSYGNVVESVGGINSLSYAFPEERVTAGSVWKRDTQVILPGMPLPAPCTNTFTVKGEERAGGYDCVRIDMKSSAAQFEMDLPAGPQKANVVSETYGSIFYAPEKGLLVRLEINTRSIPKIEGFAFNTVSKMVQDLVSCEVR